jgi:zinc/manganese transport system substrate-binding protein
MQKSLVRPIGLTVLSLSLVLCGAVSSASHAQNPAAALQVCATVPDLGYLVREIGGDQVAVTVFAKGPEDPHFVEAKPGFIKALNQTDVFIEVGMELETGWVPVLFKNARNAKILPGAGGYLDASTVIAPLNVPSGLVDRSLGDVHPTGNPHYLLDPLNGLKVARLIRDKLAELRPQQTQLFNDRYAALQQKIGSALVGEKLAKKYDFELLCSPTTVRRRWQTTTCGPTFPVALGSWSWASWNPSRVSRPQPNTSESWWP